MSDEELIEKIAATLESHVLGEANGGTASWSWITCSCQHHIRVAGTTREYVAALGRRHQAEEVLAVFREHTAPTDDERDGLFDTIDRAFHDSWTDAEEYAHASAHICQAIQAKYRLFRRGAPAEPVITDEMIQRLREACSAQMRNGYYPTIEQAEAILRAALSTERGE